MKQKLSILSFLLISIFMLSTQTAAAYENQSLESKGVYVGSGDAANGYYQPYVGNGNNYPVTVSFDIYCYDKNGNPKFLGHYTKTLPAKSGTIQFPEKRHPEGCYWTYPKNVKVTRN